MNMLIGLISFNAIFELVILACVLVLFVLFARWLLSLLTLPPNVAQVVLVIVSILVLVVFLRQALPILGYNGF
jgi:hypothetical protein